MTYPVQLLRDEKGIYGLGLIDEFKQSEFSSRADFVLRPDHLLYDDSRLEMAALQMIPGGRCKALFKYCQEERMRRAIHLEMLQRAGLTFGGQHPLRSDGCCGNFWAIDAEQERTNRNKYHGLRHASRSVINRLMAEVLAEAADEKAIKQARRFPFQYRYEIYRAGATSHRFSQFAAVFPILAVAILGSERNWRRVEARHLVESGAHLKTIADLMGIPMAFRKVLPGASRLAFRALEVFEHNPDLIHAYMPQSLQRMRLWLKAVGFANALTPGTEFAQFIARNFFEIGTSQEETWIWMRDTADWIRACARLSDPMLRRHGGEEFVTRPFDPAMSIKTVSKLNAEWHEAVANGKSGPSFDFPEPWVPGGKVGDYEILPITNNAELYREGRAMHHCVSTYGQRVADGGCYIFSIRKNGDRVATVEFVRWGERVELGQVVGPCNSLVPKEIERAVRGWFGSQKCFRLPERRERRPIIVPRPVPPAPIILLPEQEPREPDQATLLATGNTKPSESSVAAQQAQRCALDGNSDVPSADDLPDDLDWMVDDDIDEFVEAVLAEAYFLGDPEYDADDVTEFTEFGTVIPADRRPPETEASSEAVRSA